MKKKKETWYIAFTSFLKKIKEKNLEWAGLCVPIQFLLLYLNKTQLIAVRNHRIMKTKERN